MISTSTRKDDERDLKILKEIDEGAQQKPTARKFGVSHGHVQRLVRAAQAANRKEAP